MLTKIIRELLKSIDKKLVFIVLVITFTIMYYINPLDSIDLTEWNRTFSLAILNGHSISLRIGNFYKLFLLWLPVISISLILFFTYFFNKRNAYKDFYLKISILSMFVVFSSYISRYSSGKTGITVNLLIQCLLVFWIVLTIIGFIDKNTVLIFEDIVMNFLVYFLTIITSNMLFQVNNIILLMIISGIFSIIYSSLIIYISRIKKLINFFLYTMMWLPAVIRLLLEGIYFIIEKGKNVQRYFTHISRATILFIFVALIGSYFLSKKGIRNTIFGYIGAITSMTFLVYFAYNYQYTYSYNYFANIYEWGNFSVAADTILYGKVPIIDYFSAHALEDIVTQLLYVLIHGDLNGILVNPYGGLLNMLAFLILFYIIKEFFDEHVAILYVLLFPGLISGIKWMSVCLVSVLALLYILKKPRKSSYFLFWIVILIGAFYKYDEGISLGIACILAYLIISIINKEWKAIRNYIFIGGTVGGIAIALYIMYGVATGINIVERAREWISVSIGSSSTWAFDVFGDPSLFAFLVSYFIVPITATLILMFAVYNYFKYRTNEKLALITIAITLTQLLYITRTIVFHNLAVCSGVSGVLLNYIHWTVAVFVLYFVSEKRKGYNTKIFAFMGTMMFVILIEGTAVTNIWPNADSSLLVKGINKSKVWNLNDDATYNNGLERIIWDESSKEMVNQFTNVFNTLLDEEQTFLDFANVTSLYLLTDRIRPFYVGQSPSLLTDLYSQERYLEQVSKYDCPLAIIGTNEVNYLAQMTGIPHNFRYYTVFEYIYNKYRPLVRFGEFVIWADKEVYQQYKITLEQNGFTDIGYELVDYGYDYTTSYIDENGNSQEKFAFPHTYNLEMLPYVWANYDNYNAILNNEIVKLSNGDSNIFLFEGSQSISVDKGNYLAFECTNQLDEEITIDITLNDASKEGAKFKYWFTIVPGVNQYLIRVSQDYFWDVFNIDTISFGMNENITIDSVRILEGD